jgi:hypothetical protein
MQSITGITRPVLNDRRRSVLDAAVFQAAWLGCVLGGSLIALPVTVAVVVMHLWLSERRRALGRFLFITTLVGLVCDLLLVNTGVLQLPGGARLQPLWLLCLWPLFATTVPHALRWFHGRKLGNMAAGALLAPLSYFGGSRLAGIDLLQPTWLALLLIAIVWAGVFPLLMGVYCRRFK